MEVSLFFFFLFSFSFSSLLDNATGAEVNVISLASLSMPLTYYIVFSHASSKFPLFNKTQVAAVFPTVRRGVSMSPDIAENSNDRRRNSCYRAITVLGLSTDGNTPLGNFPRKTFLGREEFSAEYTEGHFRQIPSSGSKYSNSINNGDIMHR